MIWVASPLSFFFLSFKSHTSPTSVLVTEGEANCRLSVAGERAAGGRGTASGEVLTLGASGTKLHAVCVKRLESFSCEDDLVFPPYHTFSVCSLDANLLIASAVQKFSYFCKLGLL